MYDTKKYKATQTQLKQVRFLVSCISTEQVTTEKY